MNSHNKYSAYTGPLFLLIMKLYFYLRISLFEPIHTYLTMCVNYIHFYFLHANI